MGKFCVLPVQCNISDFGQLKFNTVIKRTERNLLCVVGFLGGNIICLFINRDHTDSHFCATLLPETSTDWKSQSGDNASPRLTITYQSTGSFVQHTLITQR